LLERILSKSKQDLHVFSLFTATMVDDNSITLSPNIKLSEGLQALIRAGVLEEVIELLDPAEVGAVKLGPPRT
jgi:hypothetical protein